MRGGWTGRQTGEEKGGEKWWGMRGGTRTDGSRPRDGWMRRHGDRKTSRCETGEVTERYRQVGWRPRLKTGEKKQRQGVPGDR